MVNLPTNDVDCTKTRETAVENPTKVEALITEPEWYGKSHIHDIAKTPKETHLNDNPVPARGGDTSTHPDKRHKVDESTKTSFPTAPSCISDNKVEPEPLSKKSKNDGTETTPTDNATLNTLLI